MSYRIRAEELLGESIRRAVCEQIACAMEGSRAEATDDCSPVRETRTHLKKARAALELLQPVMKPHVFMREAKRLRNVGRLISDIRDAEVRLGTVKQLRAGTSGERARSFEQTEELLAFELDSFLAAFDGWQTEAAAKLERTRSRIEQWHVAALTREQISETMRNSYKRGRASLAIARTKRTARALHDLRKRSKTLGYQLRLLRPLEPLVFHDMTADLRTLGQHLGHAHDLCFVAERLRAMGGLAGRRKRRRALESLITSREEELQRSSLALAERFYSEKPKEFSARVAAYLDRWQRMPFSLPHAA